MLVVSDLAVKGRLHGISAALRPGSVTAICGPNGAGKSTLLSAMAGLLAPDRGSASLDGHSMHRMDARARARAVGYLAQDAQIAWDVSVETLVSLGRIPWRGAPQGEAIEQAMAAMDVARLRHRPVLRLSGGERARVLMARVLAGEPRWILADEPLANLDLGHAAALIRGLRHQARQGLGVVLVLHDLAQAMNHADRVLVLGEGVLAADGPAQESLSPDVIARVWGVAARWLGQPGARALVVD